jgi:hypothetical protein
MNAFSACNSSERCSCVLATSHASTATEDLQHSTIHYPRTSVMTPIEDPLLLPHLALPAGGFQDEKS